ncbi:MAG: J domain-containing protein [Verrucomicrobiota bacterium]
MLSERKTRLRRRGGEALLFCALVPIDQEPLRRAAAADCTEAMARLEDARAGWHRFEREDKPAFARWRAREFGALLSKAREVETRIREHEALVHEVEMEMRRFFQDASSAYQRVMFRRENPAAAAERLDQQPADAGEGRRLSEFEQEALFQEWVQKSIGTNPDKMDDDAYATSFETFKTHMFRSPPTGPAPNHNRRAEPPRAEPEPEESAPAIDARVKELYRALVRRLHPDLRADGNAAVSALWHEVQEAYAASDVARMELLLALSDLESSQVGEQTSLFQMRSVLAELQRAWRALEKSVLEAQGEDAWNFARTGADEDLRVRVQRQLKVDLAARTTRLGLLTSTIASWARGPSANRKVGWAASPQFA